MRAELANLNNCAVSFLSRATVNLSSHNSILYVYSIYVHIYVLSQARVGFYYLLLNLFFEPVLVQHWKS